MQFLGRNFGPWVNDGRFQSVVVVLLVAVCAVFALWPPRSRIWGSHWFYSGLLIAAIVLSRLPWLAAGPLNPDESQFLAGARRLLFDPVFWRSVDGNTSGPLNFYALLVPRIIGFPLDYATAHLVNSICFGTLCAATYLASRGLLTEKLARLSALPVLALAMNFRNAELMHYSSECLSIALLGIALWKLSEAYQERLSPRGYALIGVIIGLLPLAKLQALPIGALVFAAAAVLAVRRLRTAESEREGVALLAGVAAVLVTLGLFLLVFDLGPTFWTSYVESNILYATQDVALWSPGLFTRWVLQPDLGPSLLGIVGFAVLALVWWRLRERNATGAPASLRLLVFGALVFAAALYAVYRPGRPFPHYLLFMTIPAAIIPPLAARLIRGTMESWQGCLALLVTTVALPILYIGSSPQPGMQRLFSERKTESTHTCDAIKQVAKPGDLVAVWGWEPYLYVCTGTVQATRDSVTALQVLPSPFRDYYRERYYQDLTRSEPRVFVDAVGPGRDFMTDRNSGSHEIDPLVGIYVAENYKLFAEVDAARVYLRK